MSVPVPDGCGAADIGGTLDRLWSELLPIGRTPAGGYRRFAWNDADLYGAVVVRRGGRCAWPRRANRPQRQLVGVVVAGRVGRASRARHLLPGRTSIRYRTAVRSTVRSACVSALCAIDLLRSRGVQPLRPVAVVVFADEEGARFGVACAGSRLLTGALTPDAARALTDVDGVTSR